MSTGQPTGIVLDRSGDIYVSTHWSEIERVTASTGAMQTIAGQTQTSFGGDGEPAVNALFSDPVPSAVDARGNLSIADYEDTRCLTERFPNRNHDEALRELLLPDGVVFTESCSMPRPIVNDKGRCRSERASGNRHRDLRLYGRRLVHWSDLAIGAALATLLPGSRHRYWNLKAIDPRSQARYPIEAVDYDSLIRR